MWKVEGTRWRKAILPGLLYTAASGGLLQIQGRGSELQEGKELYLGVTNFAVAQFQHL
jgi:hypothetical protein